MALKVDVNFKESIPVRGAYVSIDSPILTGKDSIRFVVSYRAKDGDQFFDQKTFDAPYDIVAENPFDQAYAYLKTLPEFADATDC